MRRLAVTVASLTLLSVLAVPSPALGHGTLDQQVTDTPITSISSGACPAQTFTAARSGSLVAVSIHIRKGGAENDLRVEIRDTDSGAPGANVLASTVVSHEDVPAGNDFSWVHVDFASPAPSVAGTIYAIALSDASTGSSSLGNFDWAVTTPQYTGGGLFERGDCALGYRALEVDALFQTFVEPRAIAPAGEIGGPCADPAYYAIFDNSVSTVAVKFRFRWNNGSRQTFTKLVPAGAIFRTRQWWVKPFTTLRVGYKNWDTGRWKNLATQESVKGNYPPCEYQRGFEYPTP